MIDVQTVGNPTEEAISALSGVYSKFITIWPSGTVQGDALTDALSALGCGQRAKLSELVATMRQLDKVIAPSLPQLGEPWMKAAQREAAELAYGRMRAVLDANPETTG